jgi:hypothetical protein
MTFEQICSHIKEEGCSLVDLDDNLFLARNCINGNPCLIERLEFYGIGTICHYIWELNVSVPNEIEDLYHVYSNFRNNLDKK